MNVLMAVVSDITTDARVRREAKALARDGHHVRVVAFDYGIRRPQTRHEDGVELALFPFPPRGSRRWRRLLGAALYCLRAGRTILRTDAAVYHSHNLHLAVPCALAARRGAHLVYDAHELVAARQQGVARWLTERYERAIWRRASATITTNESRARHLQRHHGPPSPLVLGNYPEMPVGRGAVDLRERLGIGPDRRVLVYQGGLYTAARCFELVAAALARLPQWHWVLIGFGSDRSRTELQWILEDAGISARAHLLPPVPVEELLALTAAGDAGLVPLRGTNLNNYLGDTNKLFEYLLAGIPAVGSDFPEIRRVIVNGPFGPVGSVFDPNDVDSVVQALVDVEAALTDLKAAAARAGRALYTWDKESEKLVSLYDQLERREHAPLGAPGPPALAASP